MHSHRAAAREQTPNGGFRYAAATFLLVGAVSTVAQFIAASSLGLSASMEWSTGGAIALIAAIWMWFGCRSWTTWRKWVWMPAVITLVMAFVTINLMVTNARESAAHDATSERAATCTAAEDELASIAAAHDDLLNRTWAMLPGAGERPEGWFPQPTVDSGAKSETGGSNWRDILSEADQRDWVPAHDRAWHFYVSNGGPELAIDLSESNNAASRASCGS